MDNDAVCISIGKASLQLLSIFTLTYLQHEINVIANICTKIPSKFLNLIPMCLAYCLTFLGTLVVNQWIQMIVSVLLIIVLSVGINYTYKDYTIDEGTTEFHRE